MPHKKTRRIEAAACRLRVLARKRLDLAKPGLQTSIRLGDRLTLRNIATREEQDCRVVYLGEKQGGRTEVGLRFKTAAPQFWALEHPPRDWRVVLS